MAVKFHQEQIVNFFQTIGLGSVYAEATGLGVDFQLGFFEVQATKHGQVLGSVTLDISTTALLKNSAPPPMIEATKQKLLQFVVAVINAELAKNNQHSAQKINLSVLKPPEQPLPDHLTPDVVGGTFDFVIQKTTKLSDVLKESSSEAEEVEVHPESNAKPSKNPVKLKLAKALLQPVKGTSEGSVYFTIGMSPRHKVAVRINQTALSIRVEGTAMSAQENQALEEYGVTKKQGYWSGHYNLEDAGQIEKILGALLFDGRLGFTTRVQTIKEIPGANA